MESYTVLFLQALTLAWKFPEVVEIKLIEAYGGGVSEQMSDFFLIKNCSMNSLERIYLMEFNQDHPLKRRTMSIFHEYN